MASDSRRWWALIAIAASVLVVGLDLTVLNLALPTLSRDLHASTGDLQWFSDAYSLVLAAAVLPAGLLGDRIGRKKVLLGALVAFGVSSAACAYSGSVRELIAALGLTALTYGFIKAGQNGWGDAASLGTILAGVVVLGVFLAWERMVGR